MLVRVVNDKLYFIFIFPFILIFFSFNLRLEFSIILYITITNCHIIQKNIECSGTIISYYMLIVYNVIITRS